MIIQSDSISMNAGRSYHSAKISFSGAAVRSALGSTMFSMSQKSADYEQVDTESHSSNAETTDDAMKRMQNSGNVRRLSLQEDARSLHKIRAQTLNYLLYVLFGRKTVNSGLSRLNDSSSMQTGAETHTNSAWEAGAGSGSAYSYYYFSENETTCFDTAGTVRTADGREMSFQINVELSRSFTQMTQSFIDYEQPALCDPLVINLDHNIAEVSDQKFYFDIDGDQEEESISMLGPHSGYLALDKNEDGIINDGSELFGTASGNGFADLAQYDRDHNGWIDEADEIFSKLKIWIKDESGKDQLLSLSEAGVGAIYLGYEDTDFSLNRLEDNTTNAVIRKTGMFLYENGGCGTVQQLDLAT